MSECRSISLKSVCILGSTGSIGKSTLDVIRLHPERFTIHALSAHTNIDVLFEQCQEFSPQVVVVSNAQYAEALSLKLEKAQLSDIEVLWGKEALISIAEHSASDTVMAAIVGASGLLPTYAAVKAGKRVLLANKEALVTSGAIFIEAVKKYNARLLPIDSEHNAIFQCLPFNEQERPGFCELNQSGINKILLTGSGGPFRTLPKEALEEVSPEQACAHPNWDMGQKISVDSATMMNKGLEFIEAKWLFNVEPEDIEVVIHPQSTIHSMVQYKDGSVLAQMGNPDMKTPIAHALSFPERITAGVDNLDFFKAKAFEFQEVDWERYPNLKLAIEACKLGQAACTALNAANEIAVDAFLNKKIKFTKIHKINETSMNNFVSEEVGCISDVVSLDQKVRAFALSLINNKEHKVSC